MRENKDLYSKIDTQEKQATQNYYKNKEMIDKARVELQMETNANRMHTDPQSRQRYDALREREQKEISDMIDGSRKIPKQADKMLKFM